MIRPSFDLGLLLLGYDYVALNDLSSRWNYPSLAAPFWRVYWNNTTGATLRIGKKNLEMRPDHLYVIPANTDFGSIHNADCRQLFIHFQIRHPYTFTRLWRRRRRPGLRGPPIIALPLTMQRQYFVRRIVAGRNGNETAQRQTALLIRALIETLLAHLMNQHLFLRKIDERLLKTLNYLEQHLDQPIDNRKLATFMHVHPQTMLRLFRAELGKAPQAYLRQLRVDKACWLLRFSDESIKAIAEATGFCDRYHFTKVFAALTGQSPARFRDYNSSKTNKTS